ncbi:MAG: hypothetical protein K8J08_11205 [Thermoanaerobaculia bacterium]|nr:hypothetical protein [Thermoanaerobaculia bacterium]
MNSRVKGLLIVVFAVLALVLFGRYFANQLSSVSTLERPPGVMLAPPPEVPVEDLGAATRSEAADHLVSLLSGTGPSTVAVHFFPSGGQELYWIIDRDAGSESLVERRSGPGNTRVETRWQGSLTERLAWIQVHGTPDAPHLASGESTNLYH